MSESLYQQYPLQSPPPLLQSMLSARVLLKGKQSKLQLHAIQSKRLEVNLVKRSQSLYQQSPLQPPSLLQQLMLFACALLKRKQTKHKIHAVQSNVLDVGQKIIKSVPAVFPAVTIASSATDVVCPCVAEMSGCRIQPMQYVAKGTANCWQLITSLLATLAHLYFFPK